MGAEYTCLETMSTCELHALLRRWFLLRQGLYAGRASHSHGVAPEHKSGRVARKMLACADVVGLRIA